MKRLLRVLQTKGEADAADTDYWLLDVDLLARLPKTKKRR